MGGVGRIFIRGKRQIRWIAYYAHGREMRESTHSTSNKVAQRLLTKRLAELAMGQFTGPAQERLMFADLWVGLVRDYEIANARSGC